MSRAFAADDSDTIRLRQAELRAEKDRILACVCEWRIADNGQLVPIRSGQCPVHPAPAIEELLA